MTIQSFHEHNIQPYIDAIARLRMEVFFDFPYIYDGDMEYEKHYLRSFANARDSVLVLAFDNGHIVGASTALPLTEEPAEIQAPFVAHGYDVRKVFYFSESVLKSGYRGKGAGVEFFRHREQWARQLGGYEYLAFCAVVRPPDHVLRPSDYRPLDDFWQRRGFVPTEMYCHMSWKDRNETEESSKPLRFWVKSIK